MAQIVRTGCVHGKIAGISNRAVAHFLEVKRACPLQDSDLTARASTAGTSNVPHSNESQSLSVSVSGKRDFAGRRQRRRKGPVTFNRSSAETKAPHENPEIRRYLHDTRKSLFVWDCVVGPGGPATGSNFSGLVCPTALKRAIARKGQFRKLSNHPLLPDKPVLTDPNVDPEDLQLRARLLDGTARLTRK
jgi:hypothetical protein